MQPQDPNQNSTPATPPPTPPAPAPEPPTQTPPVAPVIPAPTPAPITPSPIPSPTFETPAGPTPLTPQEPKKKLPTKKIIIGVVGLLLLAGLVAGIYSLFAPSGIKLSTYSGQTFSIQYPEGYEAKNADEGTVTLTEKGDTATASEVGVVYTAFPEPIDQEQVDLYKSTFKEQMQSNPGEISGDTGMQLSDIKVEDVKFQGQDAVQATAKITKDGKEVGTGKFVAVVTTTSFYMLFVNANASDPGVKAATDEILQSFAIKL